jgi:phosphate transport system substrate-binding protein
MNDDFLHRLRKVPPPEFLGQLKARLDRQPLPQAPKRSGERRVLSFGRGLVAGLLLGGAAVAIAAATFNGVPESLRALVRAPAQFLARILPASPTDHQTAGPDHHGVVPLGPAWFPTHPGPQSGGPSVDGAAPVTLASSSGSTAPTGAAGAQAAQTGATYTWSENLTIFASSSVGTLAQAAVGRNRDPGARFRVEPGYGDAFAFSTLCRAVPYGAPEIIEVSRRITAEESRNCTRIGLPDIVEVKIAYQAIALTRPKHSGPQRLSARDLFLGLAHQVPDPTRPEHFVINPNATWNQLDPALPPDPILVFGPGLTWGTGQLVQDLLLEPGCNTFPWIVVLRDRDASEYDSICSNMRHDNVYQESMLMWMSGLNFSRYANQQIAKDPAAIRLYSLDQLEQVRDKLVPIPIDGVDPTVANVANGTYPISRALYIYAIKRRVQGTHTFGMIVRYNMEAAKDMRATGSSWGWVPLPDDERTAVLASIDALKNSPN